MKIIAIDPGTHALGYAVFDKNILKNKGKITDNNETAFKRCEFICNNLFSIITEEAPDKIVCEYPIKGGPGRSSMRITIVYHLVGMIHAYGLINGLEVEFVVANKWKGQLPKEVHHPRIIRDILKEYDINIEKESPDTVDAIGLGMWYVTR